MALARSLPPLIRVGILLLAAFVLLNLALRALSTTPALDWLPERETGTGFLLDNRQRVNAAAEEYRRGATPGDRRLAAIVGISNTREGFDLGVLNERIGDNWRFLGVAGAGAGTPSIAENADILLESPLRPDLVVIGVMPIQMLDTLVVPSRAEALTGDKASSDLREVLKNGVKTLFWSLDRRKDVSLAFERMLLQMRFGLFSVLGVDIATQDARDPWRPMMRIMGAERYPDSALEEGLAWAGSLQAFERATYAQSTEGPRVLARIIDDFRARGADVLVVYTPEHPRLGQRLPPDAVDLLNAKIANVRPLDRRCFILDLRAAVDEAGFVDLVHLNTRGSQIFSSRMAAEIGSLPPASTSRSETATRCVGLRRSS